jgi:hypothetical protein
LVVFDGWGGRLWAATVVPASLVIVVVADVWSAVGGERLEAFERAEDRLGPGPVGWEVQGVAPGVVGELACDVQDPVAQPLGLADVVLAIEREQLRPDGDVVRA